MIFELIGFLFMFSVILGTFWFVYRKHKYNSRGELRVERVPNTLEAALIKKEIETGKLVVNANSDSEGKIGFAVK